MPFGNEVSGKDLLVEYSFVMDRGSGHCKPDNDGYKSWFVPKES